MAERQEVLSDQPGESWTPDPDSSPVGESFSYIPGLDGLRALAVVAVMLYHDGVSWLPAGFLGVDTFFTLSGFLITSLLIQELRHRGGVRLGAFWVRRARRLLPALFLMVAFCALVVLLIARHGTYPTFGSDAISSLFYVANWHFVLEGGNYFVANSTPSLLTHTWSLAIEEQFYVLWPLILFGLWKLGGRLKSLFALAIGGAVASTLWMAYLFHHGASLNRLYYGTDTHAQCLMVGAGLAALLALRASNQGSDGELTHDSFSRRSLTSSARRALDVVGVLGLVAGALLWTLVKWSGSFLYDGGFLVMALATALVIASVALSKHGWVSWVLSLAPLVFVGRISYGLYLWHFPLFQVLDPERTGLHGWGLSIVRFGMTFVVAIASFYLVERPIRHTLVLKGWRGATSVVVALGLVVALVLATSSVVGGSGIGETRISATAAGSKDPVKVLLVGDSVALTLGFPMSEAKYLKKYNVSLLDFGFVGCGVTLDAGNPAACSLPPTPGVPNVFEQYQTKIDTFHPNVVVILVGRWEVFDQTQNGQAYNITQAAYQAQVVSGLQRIIDMSKASGAHVVLFTTPCYLPQTAANGQPFPADVTQRVTIYNNLARRVAAANKSEVTLYDFNKLVCPTGQFTFTLNGVPVRSPDGIHIELDAGDVLDPHLYPTIVAAGQSAPNRSAKTPKAGGN